MSLAYMNLCIYCQEKNGINSFFSCFCYTQDLRWITLDQPRVEVLCDPASRFTLLRIQF